MARLLFNVPDGPAAGWRWRSASSSSSSVSSRSGFFISTLARTQLQAMQMSFFLHAAVDPAVGLHVSLPRHAVSGRRPSCTGLIPVTHFVEMIRGILLRGAPLVRDAGAGDEAGGVPRHCARDRDAQVPQATRLTFARPLAIALSARRRGTSVRSIRRCPRAWKGRHALGDKRRIDRADGARRTRCRSARKLSRDAADQHDRGACCLRRGRVRGHAKQVAVRTVSILGR